MADFLSGFDLFMKSVTPLITSLLPQLFNFLSELHKHDSNKNASRHDNHHFTSTPSPASPNPSHDIPKVPSAAASKDALSMSDSSNNIQILNHNSTCVSVKLDNTNFLIWKQQILATLRGYGLEHYVDGSVDIPKEFIQDSSGSSILNPDFSIYQRQDQLLLSWMLSTIDQSVLPKLVGCESVQGVWSTILQLFTTQSNAKVMHYKRQLQTMKKGSQTMEQYLTNVKEVCDNLLACGCPVPEVDQVVSILEGLDTPYELIVAAISAKEVICDVKTVSSLLIAAETQINQNSPGLDIKTANVADKPVCQLCEIRGHTVVKCFYRFDRSYNGPQTIDGNTYNTSANSATNMTVMMAAPEMSSDESSDSGATNQTTRDLANLNNATAYQGPSHQECSSSRQN